jgi:hypothetical protein
VKEERDKRKKREAKDRTPTPWKGGEVLTPIRKRSKERKAVPPEERKDEGGPKRKGHPSPRARREGEYKVQRWIFFF